MKDVATIQKMFATSLAKEGARAAVRAELAGGGGGRPSFSSRAFDTALGPPRALAARGLRAVAVLAVREMSRGANLIEHHKLPGYPCKWSNQWHRGRA